MTNPAVDDPVRTPLPLPCHRVRRSDVVVVGTGVAGLAAALGSSPRRVTVLTKGRPGDGGSSAWAQGGVAAALGGDDAPALHAADTLAVSGGLGDPAAVELLTREGPVRIRELIALGARFDRRRDAGDAGTKGSGVAGSARRDATAALDLGREAAHSRRRILHAGGDATGAELVRALRRAVLRAPGVAVEAESFAVDLLVERGDDGRRRVAGVLALDGRGRRVAHLADAVVLATGGLGQLFAHTTNPVEVTGDGLAMAARAGARLVDLEFVQFHPTALAAGEADGALPLLTEALRGEGAVLVDDAGRRFLLDEHPDAELAPRDVVARAIHRRLQAGRTVFLDARAAVGERFPERFPTVFEKARAAGLDPRREPLPVAPAAHYHMGGVATDERGRTSLPGLWACGEVACTGAHGANRLASNSLLEALVFGARVADDAAAAGRAVRGGGGRRPAQGPPTLGSVGPVRGQPVPLLHHPPDELGFLHAAGRPLAAGEAPSAPLDPVRAGAAAATLHALRGRLRRLMEARVGVVRDGRGLGIALVELDALGRELAKLAPRVEGAPTAVQADLHEVRNLLTAGRLVATAALARAESRGAHRREDHPAADPAWRRRLELVMAPDGEVDLSLGDPVPVPGEGTGRPRPVAPPRADRPAAVTAAP